MKLDTGDEFFELVERIDSFVLSAFELLCVFVGGGFVEFCFEGSFSVVEKGLLDFKDFVQCGLDVPFVEQRASVEKGSSDAGPTQLFVEFGKGVIDGHGDVWERRKEKKRVLCVGTSCSRVVEGQRILENQYNNV
jgi:hypothetical protein